MSAPNPSRKNSTVTEEPLSLTKVEGDLGDAATGSVLTGGHEGEDLAVPVRERELHTLWPDGQRQVLQPRNHLLLVMSNVSSSTSPAKAGRPERCAYMSPMLTDRPARK